MMMMMMRSGTVLAITFTCCVVVWYGSAFQSRSGTHLGASRVKLLQTSYVIQRKTNLGAAPRPAPSICWPTTPAALSLEEKRRAHLSSTLGESSAEDDYDYDRNAQLTKYYEVSQYLFGAMGLLLLLMPDRTMTTLLASKCGGAAGYLLAAGLSYILAGANEHGRLGSDTYKRLNIGLLGFCVLGLFALPGEAAFLPAFVPAVLLSGLTTSLKVYGAIVSYIGWRRGVEKEIGRWPAFAPREMLDLLYEGSKETFKGLKVQDKKKALTYRNCLVIVCISMFSAFMEGLFNIRVRISAEINQN